jgi:hypothetical protein
MPPLNYFHDYDKCLVDVPHEMGVYCFVSTKIQPNFSNPLWKYIEVIYPTVTCSLHIFMLENPFRTFQLITNIIFGMIVYSVDYV